MAGLAAPGRLNVARLLASCCALRVFPDGQAGGGARHHSEGFAFLGLRRVKKSRSSRVLWM